MLNYEAAQKLATDYLIRSGMSPKDFARRIGYSPNTFAQFQSGHYGQISGTTNICKAILDFIERYPIEDDNLVGNLYETGAVKILRNVFHRLLRRAQIFMVYAPPGSGKTYMARHIIEQHNREYRGKDQNTFIFRIYCRAKICPRDLMKRITTACGTRSDTAIDRAIHNLRFDFRGARVVLYFDEAQHLSIDCLEVVRELVDEEGFSLCFAGSHELDRMFAQFAGSLEQLERRITDKVTLPAVTADEATGILRSELSDLKIDAAMIRQQIELATISVRANKKTQRYISIGRLMAAISQIREGMAEQTHKQEKEAVV
jgi:DNA transposition AAA+ family ATPase